MTLTLSSMGDSLLENLHLREKHFILYVAVKSMHIKKQIKVLSITSEMI